MKIAQNNCTHRLTNRLLYLYRYIAYMSYRIFEYESQYPTNQFHSQEDQDGVHKLNKINLLIHFLVLHMFTRSLGWSLNNKSWNILGLALPK